MIFISHTAKDKTIVEPIALRLAQVYGQNNIFYDSWSIQPGDGIIDKMNEGLTNCKFFFFFVSKNSLQSNMVKLEWQNAILKASNGTAKLIPVKLDDCMMPALLLQTLYIDVFGKGLENSIRQMIDVINGTNIFTSLNQTYENVRAYIKKNSPSEMVIEFRAETYMEPISRYAILVKNAENDISINCESDAIFTQGFNKDITLNNGLICNALATFSTRATSPGFPFKVKVTSKTQIEFIGVMRAVSENEFRMIPHIIS